MRWIPYATTTCLLIGWVLAQYATAGALALGWRSVATITVASAYVCFAGALLYQYLMDTKWTRVYYALRAESTAPASELFARAVAEADTALVAAARGGLWECFRWPQLLVLHPTHLLICIRFARMYYTRTRRGLKRWFLVSTVGAVVALIALEIVFNSALPRHIDSGPVLGTLGLVWIGLCFVFFVYKFTTCRGHLLMKHRVRLTQGSGAGDTP